MKLLVRFLFVIIFTSLLYGQNSLPPNAYRIIPSLNFKEIDIRDLFRSIALSNETNITVDNKVNKKVSIALFNIQVYDAIKIIAEDNGYGFSYDERRFYIKQKEDVLPPPPPENKAEIQFKNGKIDIEVDNVTVENFVDALRNKTKRNFLIMQGTSGRISGVLKNIELDKGLKNILQNNGFYFTSKDSIYYISKSAYFSQNGDPNKIKGPYWVAAVNSRINIDVTDSNLDHILNDLFNQMGLPLIKLAVPNVNVTVKCNDVPLDKALFYLFKGTDFTYKKDKFTYLIGNKNSRLLDQTRLIKLNYIRADKVKELIPQNLIQSVSFNISIEQNAIIVSGNIESISSIEEYLNEIDKPVAQVMIEALVVDYNLDNLMQYGLSAGRGDSTRINRSDKWYPGLDVTASGDKINKLLSNIGSINLFGKDINVGKLGKLPSNFYVNIKALEQSGIANVKSKPILSTINGHTASLKIGTVQNYVFNEIMPVVNSVNSTFLEKETIQKIEATISFEITPWVGPNNELTLEIKPDFETPVGEFSPDKKLIPAINKRSLTSTVRLKDGETIVLGGLIQETETSTEDKFPLLGDIPFIGNFFKNVDKKKSKGELIIYLTPKIYYGEDNDSYSYDYSK